MLDLDRADFSFADQVAAAGAPGLRRCYACGACSAFCPILPRAAGYDPRRLIRLILLGQRAKVLAEPSLWYCSTCYSCQEVCPQRVGFTEIAFVLKNMAAAEGHLPPGLTAQVGLLSAHGRLYEITDFENEKRAKLGLPRLTEAPGDYVALLAELSGRLRDKVPAGPGGPEAHQ